MFPIPYVILTFYTRYPYYSAKFVGMKAPMSAHLTLFPNLKFVVIYNLGIILCTSAQSTPYTKDPNDSVSAIFVFGDSTSDPGNNNYITTPFKGNFAPYGRDLPDHNATGRFCNGLLATDYIARYAGIKDFVPPYLNSSLSMEELMTGVSFASAGSGFDPLTPTLSGVISIPKQLEYFKEYKGRIEAKIGLEKTKELISKSVFVVSAGTNDFVINYFTIPLRKVMYTIPQYEQFLLQNVHKFIESLWDEGARKIAVAGVPPMGCLPVVITMTLKNRILRRRCNEYQSAVAREYNKLLEADLKALQLSLQVKDHRTKIVYTDVYSSLADMVQNPSNYGFEEVSSGCCGTGYVEASILCNKVSHICDDPSKYIFWDSIHPTETAYYLVFQALRPVIDYIIKE